MGRVPCALVRQEPRMGLHDDVAGWPRAASRPVFFNRRTRSLALSHTGLLRHPFFHTSSQVFRHASARHRGVIVSVPRNRPRAAERNFTTSSSFSKGLINPDTEPIISHAMTTKHRKPLCLKHAYLQTCYFVRVVVPMWMGSGALVAAKQSRADGRLTGGTKATTARYLGDFINLSGTNSTIIQKAHRGIEHRIPCVRRNLAIQTHQLQEQVAFLVSKTW